MVYFKSRFPVLLHLDFSVFPFQEVAWRQLFNALNQGVRTGHVVQSEIIMKSSEIQFARQIGVHKERFQLGAEINLLPSFADIERFHPKPVASENEPFFVCGPDCSRKHAMQAGKTALVPLQKSMQ